MNTKKLLFIIIIAFIIGYFFGDMIQANFTLKSTAIPWTIISILLFPAGFCAQALFKLPEAAEHTSLTGSEVRRLQPIIKGKQRVLTLLIAFYVLSALTSVSLFLIEMPKGFDLRIFSVCFGLVLSSLSTFIYIRSVMSEIQRFKCTLIHRSEKSKKIDEAIKELSKDD